MTAPDMPETQMPIPLSHRKGLVSVIMDCVRAGESCSLIGVASVGKSSFLRFLLRADVRQHYLGGNWNRFLFVFVDRNKLAEVSEWGVFELFLHGMLERLENFATSEAWSPLIRNFDAQYQGVVTSRDRLLAQRYLTRWVGMLVNRGDFRFAFFLDEFDDVLEKLDQSLFLNLRALRDEYKYRISYIISTRKLLTLLRQDMETELEPFYELFSRNVFPLTPYDRTDALEMVNRLMARRHVTINTQIIEYLLKASGGHPGLLRAGFELACDTPADKVNVALERMAENYNVLIECRRIWNSVTERERGVLSCLAKSQQWADSEKMIADHLKIKGLLVEGAPGKMAFFSPVFAQFVRQESKP